MKLIKNKTKDFKRFFIIFGLVIVSIVMLLSIKLPYYKLSVTKPTILIPDNQSINSYSNYISSLSVNVSDVNGINLLKSFIDEKSSIIKKPKTSTEQITYESQLINFLETDFIAKKLAHDYADLDYKVYTEGLLVTSVNPNSGLENDLKIGDIIYSIDGIDIKDYNDIKEIKNSIKPFKNREVQLQYFDGEKSKNKTFKVKNVENAINIFLLKNISSKEMQNLDQLKELKYGSSASAAYGLFYYTQLTSKKLNKSIAVTGSLDNDGNFLPVSGIKQKIISAIDNNIDHIFVPEENYAEAIDVFKLYYGTNVRIYKVKNFKDLIDQLEKHEIY